MDKNFMAKVLAEADKMDNMLAKAKIEIKIENGNVNFKADNGTTEAYGYMILNALCSIAERVPDMRGYLVLACHVFLMDNDND